MSGGAVPVPGMFSVSVFYAVVAFCLGSWVLAVAVTAPAGQRPRQAALTAIGLGAWVAAHASLVGFGIVTEDDALPWAPMQMAVLFVGVAVWVGSPIGRRLSRELPMGALVGFQAMRIAVEVVLHWWEAEGVAPLQMTWSGDNLDVWSGIVALVGAPFAGRSRAVAWFTQLVGIGLMVNILRIVATSLPTPLLAYDEPLLLPFHLPTQFIATVCVASAIAFHGLTIRRLLTRPAG